MTSDWRKIALAGAALAIWLSNVVSAAPVLTGPPPRDITDPRNLLSPRLSGAAPVPIADLFATRSSLGAAWTADSASLVIAVDLAGRQNLWSVPVSGGFPQQLTQSEDRQFAVAVSPDGKWVMYQSDYAGAEIFDLFVVPANGGAPINLTRSADESETAPLFSADSKTIAFSQRLKTEPSNNIAVMDLATRTVRVLTSERDPEMNWVAVAFTKDGRQLIANRSRVGATESAIWSIDVSGGEPMRISPSGARYDAATGLSRDGHWIALTTQTSAGDRQAAVLDMTTHEMTLEKSDQWEQTSGRFSSDGRTTLLVTNVDGRDSVSTYNVVTRQTEQLPLPSGVNSDFFGTLPDFSPDGSKILFPHESGNTPLDYWVFDRASRTAAPVTRLAMASIDPARLPGAQVVHYRSADGTLISALVWMPFNLARDGHAAAVVLPHGGPTGQTTDRFDRTATALASRGYVVIAPNPRGSTGYGGAFLAANRRDLGGGDLDDEIYGARFLVATGYVDPSRIGITGGSYGGYMTLMAVAKTPELWAAGVEEYGIVNWSSMYERSSPGLRHYQMGLLGDPTTDKGIYDAASPLTYLKNTKAPLLVLQGDNDVRVPREEAEQVVATLKQSGDVVEAHYYPDEGHVFAKRENQIDALERTVAWFDRYLQAGRKSR
jgi:dipeptidyl aminopeptidase/acylaminoacyl peptidase